MHSVFTNFSLQPEISFPRNTTVSVGASSEISLHGLRKIYGEIDVIDSHLVVKNHKIAFYYSYILWLLKKLMSLHFTKIFRT